MEEFVRIEARKTTISPHYLSDKGVKSTIVIHAYPCLIRWSFNITTIAFDL